MLTFTSCRIPAGSPRGPLRDTPVFGALARLIATPLFKGLTLRAYQAERTFYFERLDPHVEPVRVYVLASEPTVGPPAPQVIALNPVPLAAAPALGQLRRMLSDGTIAAFAFDYWGGRVVLLSSLLKREASDAILDAFRKLPGSSKNPLQCRAEIDTFASSLDADTWYEAAKPAHGNRYAPSMAVESAGASNAEWNQWYEEEMQREEQRQAEAQALFREMAEEYTRNPPPPPPPPKCWDDPRFLAWQERVQRIGNPAAVDAFMTSACGLFDTLAEGTKPTDDLHLENMDSLFTDQQ